MKIQEWELTQIKPYENNPRKNDAAVDKVAASIQEFGFKVPIIVDRNGVIVAGHTRLKAAEKLGLKTAPVIVAEDLNDEQVKAFRLADNKTAEFAEWDIESLESELIDISDIDMDQFGFDMDAFREDGAVEIIEDEISENVETRCKLGDLWKLGNHRLICGDSTDITVIDRLMDGVKADCVFTDPPYNIASDSKNFASDVSKAMKDLSESEWDKDFDIREVLDNILVSIAENATVYVCTSHFLASDIWAWMKEWADHYQYCVWSKPNPMPSLAKRHWTWNTELICYATRGKHTFNFPKEGHALSTWTINKKNGDTGHPTEKPVEVPAMAVSHSSKEKDVVLDLFGGSGSTLIACEQLNRKCYMCELDPHYCDVIIQRWENFTGQKAVLLNE
jgi:site-specific DNA-methyltransferase (adenine-specific)